MNSTKSEQISPGVKIRAQIDAEIVKGLLLANGGGAVALLAFLPKVLGSPLLSLLALPVIVALFTFHLGIVAAIVHTHFRRKCSLVYEQYKFAPPAGTLFGRTLSQPGICVASLCCMWASVGAFLAGGCLVFIGALRVVAN